MSNQNVIPIKDIDIIHSLKWIMQTMGPIPNTIPHSFSSNARSYIVERNALAYLIVYLFNINEKFNPVLFSHVCVLDQSFVSVPGYLYLIRTRVCAFLGSHAWSGSLEQVKHHIPHTPDKAGTCSANSIDSIISLACTVKTSILKSAVHFIKSVIVYTKVPVESVLCELKNGSCSFLSSLENDCLQEHFHQLVETKQKELLKFTQASSVRLRLEKIIQSIRRQKKEKKEEKFNKLKISESHIVDCAPTFVSPPSSLKLIQFDQQNSQEILTPFYIQSSPSSLLSNKSKKISAFSPLKNIKLKSDPGTDSKTKWTKYLEKMNQ